MTVLEFFIKALRLWHPCICPERKFQFINFLFKRKRINSFEIHSYIYIICKCLIIFHLHGEIISIISITVQYKTLIRLFIWFSMILNHLEYGIYDSYIIKRLLFDIDIDYLNGFSLYLYVCNCKCWKKLDRNKLLPRNTVCISPPTWKS